MSRRQAEGLIGDWVGVIDAAGQARFAKISWHDEEGLSASLDLPGELTFRQPLRDIDLRADRLRFAWLGGRGSRMFDGRVADGRIEGAVQDGDLRGSLRLSRSIPLAPERAASYVGTYQPDAAEPVMLGLRGDAPNKSLFYARGDHLIPLYPIAPTMLLSELCETITAVADTAGGITGLRWQGETGTEIFMRKATLYAEEEVAFHNAEVLLAGTLFTPSASASGRHPGVVLMHGSMPNERDFYRIYADHFARRGIVVLTYDKRGFGASTGDRRSTIADRAEDALRGLRFLQTRPAVDARRVGLWGFSNATWSLPMAAAGTQDVAFLVATGAAGVPMAQAEVHRRTFELREWGLPEQTLQDVGRAWTMFFEYIADGRWDAGSDAEWDTLVERLKHDDGLQRVALHGYADADPSLAPIPPLISLDQLKPLARVEPDLVYDPVGDYARVICPVLFIVGAHDGNLPATEGAARVAEALERGGNRDCTITVVPDAAHSLNVDYLNITGMSTEEASTGLHCFRFVPGYLDMMSEWMLHQAR